MEIIKRFEQKMSFFDKMFLESSQTFYANENKTLKN